MLPNKYSATNLPKLPIGFTKIKKLEFKPERGIFGYCVLIIQQGKFININFNVIIKSLLTLLQSQNSSHFSVLFCQARFQGWGGLGAAAPPSLYF